jgi:purine nucleosidase
MILDVDTGIDDAMAILYALNRPGIVLEAVTVAHGNLDIVSTTRNTLQILDLAGRGDVPVAVGATRPLMKPFGGGAPHVHGPNGLGGIELPPPSRRPLGEHAANLIIRLARAHPGEITLCPVAPLTSVALALIQAPEIAGLLREIVVMGGTIFHPGIGGIPSPIASANIWNDPEAARIVLHSGAKIKLIGLDVTMKTVLTPAAMTEIAAGTKAAAKMMEIVDFYVRFYQGQHRGIAGCPLHDPLAVAVAEDPSLVTFESMNLDVELGGGITRGQIVADRRAGAKPNVDVAMDVDLPRFSARFVDTLKSAGRR